MNPVLAQAFDVEVTVRRLWVGEPEEELGGVA
jgi:hypothetical protein